MVIYLAQISRWHYVLFDKHDDATGYAGEYWSMIPPEEPHPPVLVLRYDRTIYNTLERNREAAVLGRPWVACAGVVIWKDGRIVG